MTEVKMLLDSPEMAVIVIEIIEKSKELDGTAHVMQTASLSKKLSLETRAEQRKRLIKNAAGCISLLKELGK